MGDFRSSGDGRMEMEVYGNKVAPSFSGLQDPNSHTHNNSHAHKENKRPKKGKSQLGSSCSSSSSSKGIWSLSDPELQRKKRVAGYKVYTVEGKMKGSLHRSFRWLKDKYTQVVYGRW